MTTNLKAPSNRNKKLQLLKLRNKSALTKNEKNALAKYVENQYAIKKKNDEYDEILKIYDKFMKTVISQTTKNFKKLNNNVLKYLYIYYYKNPLQNIETPYNENNFQFRFNVMMEYLEERRRRRKKS